jgi:hypothetical protein
MSSTSTYRTRSGRHRANSAAQHALDLLGLAENTPLVTRDQVRHAKPDPDLFIAAALIGVEATDTIVVGDSIWDLLAARRAGALGVGLLSGGYGPEELERAGAYRVYADPADLLDPPRRGRGAAGPRPARGGIRARGCSASVRDGAAEAGHEVDRDRQDARAEQVGQQPV